jgi:hypothetical protein
MMKKLRVDITLNDEEYEFIKGLSKRDGLTVHKELTQLLALQIWEEIQLYKQEVEDGN